MTHIVIVGDEEARDHLRAVARSFRGTGRMVSCYFDQASPPMTRGDDVAFLLVGLSNASRNEASPEHAFEREAIGRAVQSDVLCGIVCDRNGNVSASYLKELGPKVSLVVGFDTVNLACPLTELCYAAEPLFVSDLASDAGRIANTICKMLQQRRPVSWHRQQASA